MESHPCVTGRFFSYEQCGLFNLSCCICQQGCSIRTFPSKPLIIHLLLPFSSKAGPHWAPFPVLLCQLEKFQARSGGRSDFHFGWKRVSPLINVTGQCNPAHRLGLFPSS